MPGITGIVADAVRPFATSDVKNPDSSRDRLNGHGTERGEAMTWRKIRQWLGPVIVIVFAGSLLWGALKHAEMAGGPSPAAALREATSKAAHQRVLTP